MKIRFNEINVESMESNSGVFIGGNYVPNWTVFSKTQEAIGSIKGSNNNFSNSVFLFDDEDFYDFPNKPCQSCYPTPGNSKSKTKRRKTIIESKYINGGKTVFKTEHPKPIKMKKKKSKKRRSS